MMFQENIPKYRIQPEETDSNKQFLKLCQLKFCWKKIKEFI